MHLRTQPQPVGNLARLLAAAPIQWRAPKPAPESPVLLPGYLDTVEACARANACRWCLRELAARAARTRCAECGREPFRRWCRKGGPCL